MVTTIIILSLLLLVVGYLVYVLIRKNAKLLVYCESYIKVLGVTALRVRGTYDTMKQMDRLGAFEADDEVGVAFKEMNKAVTELQQFIEKYVNTEAKEEKSKEN